jgi:hypothetical protein
VRLAWVLWPLLVSGCPATEGAPDAATMDTELDAGLDAPSAADAARIDDAAILAPDAEDAPGIGMDAGGPGVGDALMAEGFVLGAAELGVVDIGDCCATSCSGNNPSSPYLSVRVVRGPGQSEPNPAEGADGLSDQFFLRSDEAIVLFGTTPPAARYFGFTPYLMSRRQDDGTRAPIFASLSETLNDAVIETIGGTAFDARSAIVLAADRTTAEDARTALERAGYPVNVLTFDPAQVRFGLDASADALGVLVRYAFPESDVRADEWLAMPRMSALRISREAPSTFDPLPTPPARAKDPDARELALEAAVDRLEAAIRAANAGASMIRDLAVTDGALDPVECIATPRFCAGDNRDTVYPAAGPFFLGRGDSLWIFGVDHDATDKATYHSCSLYAIEHLVGLRAVSSLDWAGSAARLLPADPDADQLFAWRFARDCAGDAYCTEIPVGSCPDGAPLTGALAIAFRAYVEPSTATAPDPATLVRERALVVR